jgi:transcriptional regulator with XRE-family HTH domain
MMQGSLGRRLRRARLERGLSLRAAATRVGVTKETLMDLEHGRREPHPSTLAKLAKGYGVEIGNLLGPMVEESSSLPRDLAPPPSRLKVEEEEWRRARLEEIRESYRETREGIENYLARWERWLETGGIPSEAVREFLVSARAWYPTLRDLLIDELTVISQNLDLETEPYLTDEAKRQSSLMPLVDRYEGLYRRLTEIWDELLPDEPPVDIRARQRETLRRRAV